MWTVVERDLPRVRLAIGSLLPSLDALEREISGDEAQPFAVIEDEQGPE